jgi:hypothetical protein
MKRSLLMFALSMVAVPAIASDVGIAISVGQPGFYGQINLGNFPPPQVIYSQPVIVQPEPAYEPVEPIFLHVPPGYERHWERYCREYRACDRPVYFVRDRWYNQTYVPRYQESERHREEGYRDDRLDERRDDGYEEHGGHDHHDEGYGDYHGHDRHDDGYREGRD